MILEIRPITAGDIEGFHRAVDIVARERKYLAFLEAPPLASAREFVLENIAKGNPQFVAIADGGVAGWCDIVRQSRPIHAHAGVLGMGLLPPFRGQGHGRKLVEASLHAAKLAGFSRVELTVHADNPRAIALYERVGFVREGIKRRALCIDGQFGDTIMMATLQNGRDRMLKPFNPPGMVQPASRYSQGVDVGANARWLHISGQIGVAPDGKVAKGLEAQFKQAFENIGTVLAAAGMAKTDLVKVTVFVTVPDLETVGIYRKARDQWMEGHAPAATYLGVAGLAHRDYLVEIEAIAAK